MNQNAAVIALRLLRAAISALAVSVVTLAQLNLPSKDMWGRQPWLLYVCVIVVAAVLVYDAVLTVDHVVRAGRIRDYDLQLRASLSATVAEIVDEFGVPWDQVAVYHYRVILFGRWRRLRRVGGLLAGIPPADIQPVYAIGKGVPGMAVKERMFIAEAWRDLVERWERTQPAQWENQDVTVRYGLNWGELMRSERLEGIVANPIFSPAGRPIGCTLVTGPLKQWQLSSNEMRRILSNTATQMHHVGAAPRGWWRHAG